MHNTDHHIHYGKDVSPSAFAANLNSSSGNLPACKMQVLIQSADSVKQSERKKCT